MKAFNNYENTVAASENKKLPAGGYEIGILGAEEKTYDWGSVLEIKFDICEGEYKNFYTNQFKASTVEDKKYKGTYRINVPKDDGTDMDEWTKRKFKRDIEAIEASNPGYKWDWDEKKLKGKKVGAIFFEKEYEFNGTHGFFTTCHSFKGINDIKSGNFVIPKPKLLKGSAATAPANDPIDEIDDDDLPF